MISPLHPRQMIQTRDHLIINTEYGDEIRIVRFARAHTTPLVPSRMGDGIARWDGDTLVIETVGFSANSLKRFTFPSSLLLSEQSKVIEHYTRISKDELLYQFTIEDPALYVTPWLAEYSLFRAGFRMFPSGCHEGNYSLPNILAGQRAIDIRRREAFKPNDVNGDGKLNLEEFTKLLKSTGATGSIDGAFKRRDTDKDGFITAKELDAEVKL
jgi:EF hand